MSINQHRSMNMIWAKQTKYLRAALAGLAFVAGVSMASAAEGTATLATLANGEKITEEDLLEQLARRVDLRGSARNSWGVENVLREMAMTRALMHEGEKMGEPRQEDRKHLRFDDAYALAILKKMSPACDAPADVVAARKYYDEHPEAFQVPSMARLSRVMLPKDVTLEGEPAGGWLLMQAQAIASGAKKLDEVARQAEAVHKVDLQGDLGWVTLVEEIPILRALAGAQQGELVGPVPEGDFIYLFHVAAKREGRTLAWEEVAASASKRAVIYCREQSNKQLQEQMFKKYGVVINQPAIRELFKNKKTKQ